MKYPRLTPQNFERAATLLQEIDARVRELKTICAECPRPLQRALNAAEGALFQAKQSLHIGFSLACGASDSSPFYP